MRCHVLEHPPYLSDQAPCDFYLYLFPRATSSLEVTDKFVKDIKAKKAELLITVALTIEGSKAWPKVSCHFFCYKLIFLQQSHYLIGTPRTLDERKGKQRKFYFFNDIKKLYFIEINYFMSITDDINWNFTIVFSYYDKSFGIG